MALVVALVLAFPRIALPCTQAFLTGTNAPRDGDVYPQDGHFWIAYGGPIGSLEVWLDVPRGPPIPLVLERYDPDLVRALTPPFAVEDYRLRISGNFPDPNLPRTVRFTGAPDPVSTDPLVPASWSASFHVITAGPCSSGGLQVTAEITPAPGPLPTAYRLFDVNDGRALGSALVDRRAPGDPIRISGLIGRVQPTCVQVAAMSENAALEYSRDIRCWPATAPDAGTTDSGATDAGAPPPDLGSPPTPDGGPRPPPPPLRDAGPPTLTPTDLAEADAGCGCRTSGAPTAQGLWALVGLAWWVRIRRRQTART